MGIREIDKTVERVRAEVREKEEAEAERLAGYPKARAAFTEAVKRLKGTEAEPSLRRIAAVLPGYMIVPIYDFDKAGGPGFSPRIELKGPKKEVELNDWLSTRGYVSDTAQSTLSVVAYIHDQNLIDVDVWESHWYKDKDGHEVTSGVRMDAWPARDDRQGHLNQRIY